MNGNIENNTNNNLNNNNTNIMSDQQPNNMNISDSASKQVEETLSNNNMSYTESYQEPKKKTGLIIIVLIILGVIGYFVFNKNTDSNTYESEAKKELVGTWKATEETNPNRDGAYIIPNFSLKLNDDNSFTMDGEYKIRYTNQDGGSTIVIKSTGKYVFNKKGNQIKLLYDGDDSLSFHTDFTGFKIENDKLYIGEIKYNKISNNSSDNNNNNNNNNNNDNNTNTTTTNSIVGKWYWFLDNKKDESIYYVFNEDGTATYIVNGAQVDLKYKIEGDSLFIGADDDHMQERSYKISNGLLYIDDGVGTNVFIKE